MKKCKVIKWCHIQSQSHGKHIRIGVSIGFFYPSSNSKFETSSSYWRHRSKGQLSLERIRQLLLCWVVHLSRLRTKPTKWHVRRAKTQISLGFLHADSEDSNQIGRMPRLIWVFTGRTCHFVGFVMRRLTYVSQNTNSVVVVVLCLSSQISHMFVKLLY